jgi:hypothetical protein
LLDEASEVSGFGKSWGVTCWALEVTSETASKLQSDGYRMQFWHLGLVSSHCSKSVTERKEGRAEKMLIVTYFDAASFALEASCPDFPMGCLFMLHLMLFRNGRRIASQEASKDEGTKYEARRPVVVRQMQVSLLRLLCLLLLVGT